MLKIKDGHITWFKYAQSSVKIQIQHKKYEDNYHHTESAAAFTPTCVAIKTLQYTLVTATTSIHYLTF